MITSDNTEDASLMRNTTSNTHTHTHTNTHVHAHAHTHIQGYQSAGLKQFEAEGVSVDRIELSSTHLLEVSKKRANLRMTRLLKIGESSL